MTASKLPGVLRRLTSHLARSATQPSLVRSHGNIAQEVTPSLQKANGQERRPRGKSATPPPLSEPHANTEGFTRSEAGASWRVLAGFTLVGGLAGMEYAKRKEERAQVLAALNSAIPMLISGNTGAARIRKLREGSTGVIYAVQTETTRWAVKVMSKDEGMPELEALKSLKGKPGVIELHAYGIDEGSGRLFLALDHADGDLYRMFTDGLGEEEARRIFPQILEGLRSIHGEGYVHGDLSPDNVLLFRGPDATTRYALGDLGNTRKEGDPDLATMKFTPNFADPNSARGKPDDIYALGKTLEFLSQQDAPAQRSPELNDLIGRMTASKPEQRPTVDAVFAHPWVRESESLRDTR